MMYRRCILVMRKQMGINNDINFFSLTVVYSTVHSGADQRKHQSSASLAFVRGIHRGPGNSPHKWPVTRKMFPFDDVIMIRNNGHPPLTSVILPSWNSCFHMEYKEGIKLRHAVDVPTKFALNLKWLEMVTLQQSLWKSHVIIRENIFFS